MVQLPEPAAHGVVNSVGDGVEGMTVQAGTIQGGVHVHYGGMRPPVEWPYRFGVVPPRAASFQHRAPAGLVDHAFPSGAASTTVLSGLGGVGKTQLAVDCAENLWSAGEIEMLVWITASSRNAIVSGYTQLTAKLTGTDAPDPEHGARQLLSWLAATQTQWLVVLDDVRSPADLRELWPPTTPFGRTVVTTRRRDAALRGHQRHLVEIDVFTPAEAHAYLTAALADRPHLLDGTDEVVAELGYLPLALAQAAAYMIDRHLSCATYLARLADRRRRLASLLPEADELPDDHQATVTVTWSLSIEQANQLQPAGVAGVLLAVASLLDANGIPTAVFAAPPVLALATEAAGREITEDEARDGLGCLHRLSLATLNPDSAQRAIRVHALVQRVTRDALSDARLARAVADALLWVWPDIERDTLLGQVLRANADALSTVSGTLLWRPDAHPLLFRCGRSLGGGGAAAPAADYFQRLHASATRHLGTNHQQTLAARHSMAYWRAQAGDPATAAANVAALLADQIRELGADHPDALTSRHDLARWRGEAGDPTTAVAALAELLPDRIRVLGPDHPDALRTRHELARWHGEAGHSTMAVNALTELLADRMRVLGPDHPHTLRTRHDLAGWRGAAGDPTAAATALAELLADRTRVLGPDHPDTLRTRHNLASWRGEAGDPAAAVTALEGLVVDRMRVSGPDHPQTQRARNSLGHWQRRLPNDESG